MNWIIEPSVENGNNDDTPLGWCPPLGAVLGVLALTVSIINCVEGSSLCKHLCVVASNPR